MKPTHADWIKTVADVCPGLVSPMPLTDILRELQWGNYSAEAMVQHLLVHLAKLHMDRDDELERLRDKLGMVDEQMERLRDKLAKIRDILDAEVAE